MYQRLLLASIHDVGPMFASETEALFERLSGLVKAPRIAMLVVPDHWGRAPLSAAPGFAQRLRHWADMGVEMFVHGWYHKDMASHQGLAQFKARHMTAGEGEFLGLDAAQAAQRMAAGKALIEDITGRAAAGFIAPAWLYGPGARAALRASDLPLAEDHFRVWQAQSGRVVARGPVITWATRSPMRQASSLAFAALARHALRPLPVVRVAVHPGDAHSPAVLNSIDSTFKALLPGRRVARYHDLISGPAAQLSPHIAPMAQK
jgi:predicted deacetylase